MSVRIRIATPLPNPRPGHSLSFLIRLILCCFLILVFAHLFYKLRVVLIGINSVRLLVIGLAFIFIWIIPVCSWSRVGLHYKITLLSFFSVTYMCRVYVRGSLLRILSVGLFLGHLSLVRSSHHFSRQSWQISCWLLKRGRNVFLKYEEGAKS